MINRSSPKVLGSMEGVKWGKLRQLGSFFKHCPKRERSWGQADLMHAEQYSRWQLLWMETGAGCLLGLSQYRFLIHVGGGVSSPATDTPHYARSGRGGLQLAQETGPPWPSQCHLKRFLSGTSQKSFSHLSTSPWKDVYDFLAMGTLTGLGFPALYCHLISSEVGSQRRKGRQEMNGAAQLTITWHARQ